jgi:hypothetical protein
MLFSDCSSFRFDFSRGGRERQIFAAAGYLVFPALFLAHSRLCLQVHARSQRGPAAAIWALLKSRSSRHNARLLPQTLG